MMWSPFTYNLAIYIYLVPQVTPYQFIIIMEGLFESGKTYADTLKKCSLPQVAEWKLGDIQRAIRWDEYFTIVQTRLSRKPSRRKQLDLKLQEIGRELGVRFGEEEFSYDFLTHSLNYFVKCLLDNPFLPEELRMTLSEQSPSLTQKHLSAVEENKLLLSSLTAISDQLALCCHDDNEDFLCDLKLLNAAYLRKDLRWILEGGQSGRDRAGVWRRLDSLVRVDGGMETILIALLQDDNSNLSRDGPSHLDRLDLVGRALFDWLMQAALQKDRPGHSKGRGSKEEVKTRPVSDTEREGGMDGEEDKAAPEPDREPEIKFISSILWKNSHCKLLAKVSLRYFEFFKEHFKFLVSVAKAMEKTRLESCLTVHLHSTEQAEMEASQMEEMEVSQIEEIKLSQMEMEVSQIEEIEVFAFPGTLDEQVESVANHWLALCLMGGHPRTVCLAFLANQSKQVSQAVQQELSYGGRVLRLRPPNESVWNTVLKSVLTACEYDHHCKHSQKRKR